MNRPFTSARVPALQGARVLVIEDDALLLMELEATLSDAGAQVVSVCRTVEDGVAAAQQDGITAAVLDVRIGRDTIAPVARALANRGTPFVFYTGQLGSDPAIAEWPSHTVVAKPAQADTIVAAVADLLRRGNLE
jgi:DNA-binding NtrC family response regulator